MSNYIGVKRAIDTATAFCGGLVKEGGTFGLFSYDDGVVFHQPSNRVLEAILKKPQKLDAQTVLTYASRVREAKEYLAEIPNPDAPAGEMVSMIEQQDKYSRLLKPTVRLMHISEGSFLHNLKKEYLQGDGKLVLSGDVFSEYVGSIFDEPKEYDPNAACAELVDRIGSELQEAGISVEEGGLWTLKVGDIAKIKLIGHIFDAKDRRKSINGIWYKADITEATTETLVDTLAQVAPIYNIAAHTIQAFYNPELKGYAESRMDKVFEK